MDSHTGRALEGSGILGRPAEEQRRLVAEFSDRARAVAARVSGARSLAEAARIIAETADAESPAGRYIATSDVIAAYPDLSRELGEHGVKLESDIEAGAEAAGAGELAAALMGGVVIVAGRTGVAETGSVLVGDFSLSARLVEMLAETCYVLLPAHALLPGLDEMGKLLAEKPPPAIAISRSSRGRAVRRTSSVCSL
ncbi:MAG: LUD domain-containing protein [Chloroflexia bacterium]